MKISKRQSEAVNHRMLTGKKDKRTNNDLQNTTYKIKDTKGVIRSYKSKDRQYNGQKKKEQTMIYKTLHRKLKMPNW